MNILKAKQLNRTSDGLILGSDRWLEAGFVLGRIGAAEGTEVRLVETVQPVSGRLAPCVAAVG